jgi:KUP system potassium uptake protein
MISTGTQSSSLKPNDDSRTLKESSWALNIIVLGVVFGDIGTSPLYALRECFAGNPLLSHTPENILGIVSLILWTLILLVSVKYILIVIRADNNGEGGILALMTLVHKIKDSKEKQLSSIVIMGILGAALLCGDGIITPAITIMSSVEGLSVATTMFIPFIVPLSIITLVALFVIQSFGTEKIGSLFGPIMLLWFTTIGILGFIQIFQHPAILAAVNPMYALRFYLNNGLRGFETLGSVFLAVTGAEALYADLGHLGRKPIQISWFSIVFPSLILSYFGQGAYLIESPQVIDNLFYRSAPSWLLYPLVILATTASVIASQAVISGVFSLAKQSVQLGLWPRVEIRHTSTKKVGQVYVPFMNWLMLIGTIILVLGFQESSRLAGAYGIAVSATMFITTVLTIIVARYLWSIPYIYFIPLALVFLMIDLVFFLSNAVKIMTGGWIVLLISTVIFILIKTWIDGRLILSEEIKKLSVPLDVFLKDREQFEITKVSGTAVFLSANTGTIPAALLHNLEHNKVLHEKTIMLTVHVEDIPYVKPSERARVENFGDGIYRIELHYGFSETPDIPAALNAITYPGLTFEPSRTTYFLGRKSILISHKGSISVWRKKLYKLMSHMALDTTFYFNLPQNRTVEMGARLEL